MWGFSPALDLLDEYEKAGGDTRRGDTLNLLLLGSTDARHVLKTVSRRRRRDPGPLVDYHLLELVPELVARQVLLLSLALEPGERLGPVEKSRIWMEIYGNTLLRPSSARYLVQKSVQMVRLVTDPDYLRRRMPCLDLDLLRYKERDLLEGVFSYWRSCRTSSLSKVWDGKLRAALGRRYDSRIGVFDWDYNMKLAEVKEGKRVCLGEYKHWRNTGVAFTWLETEASVSNPTLAVGIGSCGDQLFSRGYIGDMETGPYFGFGTDCEEEGMLETRNGLSVRRATDITERHLQRIFHEIETGAPPLDLYTADREMGLLMGTGFLPASPVLLEELDFEPDRTPEEYSALPIDGQKVLFLPGNFLSTQLTKAKYKGFFDMVYIAHNYFKFISEDILRVLKPDCLILVETRKFAIAYDKNIPQFGKEVREKMKELGGVELHRANFKEDSLAFFRLNLTSLESKDDLSSQEMESILSLDEYSTQKTTRNDEDPKVEL